MCSSDRRTCPDHLGRTAQRPVKVPKMKAQRSARIPPRVPTGGGSVQGGALLCICCRLVHSTAEQHCGRSMGEAALVMSADNNRQRAPSTRTAASHVQGSLQTPQAHLPHTPPVQQPPPGRWVCGQHRPAGPGLLPTASTPAEWRSPEEHMCDALCRQYA